MINLSKERNTYRNPDKILQRRITQVLTYNCENWTVNAWMNLPVTGVTLIDLKRLETICVQLDVYKIRQNQGTDEKWIRSYYEDANRLPEVLFNYKEMAGETEKIMGQMGKFTSCRNRPIGVPLVGRRRKAYTSDGCRTDQLGVATK